MSQRAKTRYHASPEFRQRRKFDHIALRYRLSQQEWQALWDSQQGKCAICEKKLKLRPFTDHDHKTGRVRGLLCGPCNMYIGHIKERPAVLHRAAGYLLKFSPALMP